MMMTPEVTAESGPGAKRRGPIVPETQRMKDLFMETSRKNNGEVTGELEGFPGIIITMTGAQAWENALPHRMQCTSIRPTLSSRLEIT